MANQIPSGSKSGSSSLRKYSYYFYSIFELLFGFENPFQIISIFLSGSKTGLWEFTLCNSGLHFRLRSPMDVWSIKETFLDRFYEVYGFPVQAGWTVIDIGAGLGEYTLYAAQTPGSKVFAFEPFPESFALLKENLTLNHLDNIQAFEEAIGAQSGELTLDLSSGEPLQFSSSIGTGSQPALDSKPVQTKPGHGITVRSSSLVDVFLRLGLESCDLIKLDCEGAEYDILFNTPPTLLKKIGHLVMEYHDNATAHDHLELERFLEEHGFKVETYPNPVHSYLGYLRAGR